MAARAALEFIDKVNVTVNAIKKEKGVLLEKLNKFNWLEPSPSSSNFVLFHVTGHFTAAQVAALLRKAGVLVRYFSTPVLKDYVRISVGRPQDTEALVKELEGLENTWKILDEYLFILFPFIFLSIPPLIQPPPVYDASVCLGGYISLHLFIHSFLRYCYFLLFAKGMNQKH